MPDPVSWLVIRPGWKVYGADGSQVGEVDEVAGDQTRDIFDGIALATSVLGKPRYVRAEQVARIEEGEVHLSLSAHDVDALDEYLEPATSARIEADNRGGMGAELAADARNVEGAALHPIEPRERSMNIWRRLYLAIRRSIGR